MIFHLLGDSISFSRKSSGSSWFIPKFWLPKIFLWRKVNENRKSIYFPSFSHCVFKNWRPITCYPMAQWTFFVYQWSPKIVVDHAQKFWETKLIRRLKIDDNSWKTSNFQKKSHTLILPFSPQAACNVHLYYLIDGTTRTK